MTTTSDSILEKVKGIENKIGRMILVVIVAFSVLSVGFLVGKLVLEGNVMEKKGDNNGGEIVREPIREDNGADQSVTWRSLTHPSN